MSLLLYFEDFLRTKSPFQKSENTYLIAVSGGVDSMVLLHLCRVFSLPVQVAHTNFHLRGEDSNADEALVKNYCFENKIPFLSKSFPLLKERSGIEEQARKLRYEWFYDCLTERKLDYILTAHHSDDNIETVLMNFFRGSGLLGMTGIPYQNDKIIRPLLPIAKEVLYTFARAYQVPFREDLTNQENHFTRNFYRNELLPILEKRIPNVRKNILENRIRFEENYQIYKKAVHTLRKKILHKKGEIYSVSIKALKRLNPLSTWLYELFKEFGVKARQVLEIKKLLQTTAGKYIRTPTHQILNHNGHLLISPLSFVKDDDWVFVAESPCDTVIMEKEKLTFSVFMKPNDFLIPTCASVACVDRQAVSFPLVVRKWRAGDYLYPLGMKKKKKLSRLFIDLKLSLSEKEKIWVVESAEKIVWVVGIRIDNRVKITHRTESILQIRYQANASE